MKKILLFACAMFAFVGKATAEDTFSVDNVTLPQNGEADVVVRFNLDEGSTCSGYYFNLQVPQELEFVTYEKNSKTYVSYTAGDCYDETPTITPNIDDGFLKVGCLNANSDPLNKQSGILVIFRIKTNSTISVGDTFTGTLTEGTISAENGTIHDVANTTFTITISEPADSRTILDEASTVMPEAATGVDVSVKRTLVANVWYTIVLPFAMTSQQMKEAFGDGIQLADFTGYEASYDDEDNVTAIKVNFSSVSSMEANHPYIIKVNKPISEFTLNEVDIDPEEEPVHAVVKRTRKQWSEMIGTYVANTEVPEMTLFLSGNQFWYSTGNTKMKAFRAYFDFYDVLTDVEASGAKIIFVVNDEVSDIVGVSALDNVNGDVFTVQGIRVGKNIDMKHLPKGLYIVNGKKYTVK